MFDLTATSNKLSRKKRWKFKIKVIEQNEKLFDTYSNGILLFRRKFVCFPNVFDRIKTHFRQRNVLFSYFAGTKLIGLFISIVAIDFESKRSDDDVGSFPLCPKQSLQMANEATDILFMSKNDSLIIISSD